MIRVRTLLALLAAVVGLIACATGPEPLSLEEKHRRMRENWTPAGLLLPNGGFSLSWPSRE